MPECPGILWISVAIQWARRHHTLLLNRLASCCPGPGSRCAARQIAPCESLNTATIFTLCICKVSLFSIATSSASPIAHSSASKISNVRCPERCCETSTHFRVYSPLRLPLGRRLSAIHHFTTSRHLVRFWLHSPLRSAAWRFWLQPCLPIW
jgi:hypothetical protein